MLKMYNYWCKCILLSTLLTDHVFGDSKYFCKDSVIDAITYADDVHMYWLSSGSHFWWLKETEFPPPDSLAKPFSPPFTGADAAVYVDSYSGCRTAWMMRSLGMDKTSKHVWVTQLIGGQQWMQAWSPESGQWLRDRLLPVSDDHCASRAIIGWSDGRPLDAMFATNYLNIWYVKGDTLAMVDCNFMCTNPRNKWGEEKRPQSVNTSLLSLDKIYGIFVKKDHKDKDQYVYVFYERTYRQLSISQVRDAGEIVTTDDANSTKNILKDFLRIENPGISCGTVGGRPTSTTTNGSESTSELPIGHKSDDTSGSGSGGNRWLWIAGVTVIVVIIAITFLGLLTMMRMRNTRGPTVPPPPRHR